MVANEINRKTVRAAVLALALAALTAACNEPPLRNVVRVATDVDAEILDPRLGRNTTDFRVANLMFDGLVQLNAALEPVPDLAESWEQLGPTSWLFHLRDSSRFHDGAPVTAADVVYTFETILDPELRAPSRNLYVPIDRIEAVDDLTVRFTLAEPYAPLLNYLDLGIVPKHLAESGHDLGSHPVGSGPYRFRRWEKGSRILLEANTDHWSGTPQIAEIDVVLVPDNTSRAQAFEAGDLDLIQSPLAPQDIARLAEDDRFARRIELGIATTYLNFNTSVPLLADRQMRRALSMLVDQETILGQIYEGMDEAASSILLPSWWAYSSDVTQPSYDPDAARRLLAEMGWRDSDGDGVRDKNGRSLVVRLGTHSEDVNRVQTVEYLQNTFAQHGIATNIQISDWPSFAARRDAGDFEIILLGWTQLMDPDRATFEQLHSTGGLNWGRYRNARLDQLLERGRTAQAQEERAAAYREAARLIAQEVPYYILSYQGYQVFYNPRIEGFEPNVRGLLRSLAKSTLMQ
jgi:peptide/nickel transport system substrate-binding protein